MSLKSSLKKIKKMSKDVNNYLFCLKCNSFYKETEKESHCNLINLELSEIKEKNNKDDK